MKYEKYNNSLVCPKCNTPIAQNFKKFFTGSHKLVEEKVVIECHINEEHIHILCSCGFDYVVRPMDWNKNKGVK